MRAYEYSHERRSAGTVSAGIGPLRHGALRGERPAIAAQLPGGLRRECRHGRWVDGQAVRPPRGCAPPFPPAHRTNAIDLAQSPFYSADRRQSDRRLLPLLLGRWPPVPLPRRDRALLPAERAGSVQDGAANGDYIQVPVLRHWDTTSHSSLRLRSATRRNAPAAHAGTHTRSRCPAGHAVCRHLHHPYRACRTKAANEQRQAALLLRARELRGAGGTAPKRRREGYAYADAAAAAESPQLSARQAAAAFGAALCPSVEWRLDDTARRSAPPAQWASCSELSRLPTADALDGAR